MKRLTGFWGLALLGGALTVLVADTAFAQRGGGGRGGGSSGGWGWGPGGFGYHGSTGSWRGGWTPGSGFYAYPRGYGYGGYYDGYGYGRGYYDGYGYGRGYGYGYPGYSSYYYPSYSYGPGYNYGYWNGGYGYAPSYGGGYGPSYAMPTQQDSSTATVQVKLPDANAEVWFDGQKTRQNGSTRTFTTPPLDGQYQYQISAAWHQDGRLVTQERTVSVKPGANVTVDFTQTRTSDIRDAATPQTRDLESPNPNRTPQVRPPDRSPDKQDR